MNTDVPGNSHVSAQTKTAADLLRGRVLLQDSARYIESTASQVDSAHGGIILAGEQAEERIVVARRNGHQGLLLLDPCAYLREVGRPTDLFALPHHQLFATLDDVLTQQIESGASVAVTPTRRISAGDADTLKALIGQSKQIERTDTIVTVPVDVGWLRQETLKQLQHVLSRIDHPKALVLVGQRDPLSRFGHAPTNLRHLMREVPNLGIIRTDLAAIDAVVHGGQFAAIGAGGSIRHALPTGEKAEARIPHYPAVLVPDLMRFSASDWLADRYANTAPMPCICRVCNGAGLDQFADLKLRARAHAHNVAVWSRWVATLVARPAGAERQRAWRDMCVTAVRAYAIENARIDQPNAFKRPEPLQQWATLPVGDPAPTTPAGFEPVSAA
jgi:hypothetical protein